MNPRWMRPGWVYIYRTRKPWARWGCPIIGRHFGYAGQTRNPRMRDLEHRQGGGRYGQPAACWSDLDPKRYIAFYLPMCPQWLLDLVEILVIRLLLPVYNVQYNRGNPRRITRWSALEQRAARDAGFRPGLLVARPASALAVLALLGLVLWVVM